MMSFGIDDLRDIAVNVFPEFAPAVVEIQTEALELSAAEVEDLITFNLGALLGAVSWRTAIRPWSVVNLPIYQLQPNHMRAGLFVQGRGSLASSLPNLSNESIRTRQCHEIKG
jgi:hypothetical protein